MSEVEAAKDAIKPPETDKPNESRATVNIDLKNTEIRDGDDDAPTEIRVPVSGVGEDRDGDEFSEQGLKDMVAQINEEPIGMFPNHGMDKNGMNTYPFQRIMGRWDSATMDDGQVYAEATLREGNDDAEELKDLMNQQMPVGFSVGFGWDESDAEEKGDGGMRFHSTDMMEISPVGIPSKDDAILQASSNVAEAMKSAGVDAGALDPDTLAHAIKQSMSEDAGDGSEEENAPDEQDEQDVKQMDEEQVQEALSTFAEYAQSHMDAAIEEAREDLLNGDGEEETEEADEDGEEEEEEDEEKDALKSEIEELRQELEAVKTQAAESSERKGMEPHEGKGESEEEEESEQRTANLYDAGAALGGD